jgi:predicted metal-dependent hydrolase
MMQQLSFDLAPAAAIAKPAASLGSHWREVQRAGVTVGYTLQRSRRRSIGLVVGDEGLRVSAPHWVSLHQIDEVVLEKFDWVQRKLQAVQARQAQLALAQSNWRDGGTLAYLGCRLQLTCGAAPTVSGRGQVWFEGDPAQPSTDQRLWLPLNADAGTERVRDMAHGWLQRQAKTWFGQRLKHFETTCGLHPKDWKLSSASTRWGACNSEGRIMLNWRLIHFAPHIIDYVIAHELAHLKVLNHSQSFWDTLGEIYPQYMEGHRALKGITPGDTPAL